ncbi:MAG TPA: hypothetical protein VJA26_18520, partial [Gammaproteobacteria bacterium]|nr:hypothetical protein [Gammaproteobacteria bacterium]
TAFKALDRDFACRGVQFVVGKSYKHDGEVVICSSGFHACSNPFDVWRYYELTEGARYAVVELSGVTVTHDEDSKIASAEITIKAELKLPEFVSTAVKWLIDFCKEAKGESVQAASGHAAQLAASGDSAKLAASGHAAQLAASGDYAQLAASGKDSVIASSSLDSRAKGTEGTWMSLAEFNSDGKCVGFATGCAGDDVPADVWLKASGGKLVAAKE